MSDYAPECRAQCDICSFGLDNPYVYFEDTFFEPTMTPDEFKQVAHTMTLDRLKQLAEQSRAACKTVKEAAKQAWASAKTRLMAKLAAGRKSQTEEEDELLIGTYRRFPQPHDRLLG
jgi:hypothetical protein